MFIWNGLPNSFNLSSYTHTEAHSFGYSIVILYDLSAHSHFGNLKGFGGCAFARPHTLIAWSRK